MASRSIYSTLPSGPDKYHIRLLKLHSGPDVSPISCDFCTLDLTQAGDQLWDAFSYVWGPKSPRYSISICGQQTTIRENLYRFLIEMRRLDENVLLWVDSLCIDQSDLDERASQVSFMEKIYKGARRVLTWLGPADNDGTLATDLIHQIAGTPSSIVSPSDHRALLSWAARPYWTRSWIVQEFLLAKDISLFVGHKKLEWSVLARFMQHFLRGLDLDPSWASFVRSPAYILIKQRTLGGRIEAPLAQLLIRNQDTECEDPRDKIYSLIGLATKPELGRTIQPSYTKGLPDLAIEVLESCQIPSRDKVRFVGFLLALLRITPEDLSSTLRLQRSLPSFELTGFLVGIIIHVDIIETSAVAAYELHRHNHHYKAKLRDYRTADISRMLNDLDDLNIERLRLAHRVASQAHRDTEVVKDLRLVLVLTSNCEQSQILVGLASGLVRREHQIVYFLGHHNGMILERSKPVGTVVCARTDGDKRQDVLTRQNCKYWSLQNESDLISTNTRVSLELRADDILKFAH